MNKEVLIEKLTNLIQPIVNGKNYELYHLEYIKESGENYLRIYIDSPGGIGLDDCEKVSRVVSDKLDEIDPIEESYYLEVSSPGIDRILYTDMHLRKYMGSSISIKLFKLFNGKKKYDGKLVDFNKDIIIIGCEECNLSIPRKLINTVNLKGEL